MNNWFGLFNFLLAKKQLNENGITDTPPEMLFSLLPGMKIPPIHQLIETREVVKRRIEEDVNAGLSAKINLLNAENASLTNQNSTLGSERTTLESAKTTLESDKATLESAKATLENAKATLATENDTLINGIVDILKFVNDSQDKTVADLKKNLIVRVSQNTALTALLPDGGSQFLNSAAYGSGSSRTN